MTSATTLEDKRSFRFFRDKNVRTFGILWLLTFIIYLPAAKAGWVIDSAGWLWNIRNLKFWDYVNNAQSTIPSLYQFTQLATYAFYKIFNANVYAWHMLMVTMHAVNAFLFYLFCDRLFRDSGIKNGTAVAAGGVVLFTVCPHISEVIVWEAAYHYLQGFLFILLILLWVQKFHHNQHSGYALLAGGVYLCSTYSLEIFYLTPWFMLALCLYYRFALGYDQAIFKKALLWFFVPQIIMFLLHIGVLLSVYGQWAHLGQNVMQPFSNYICKPPRYIFHILFLGRYFPNKTRQEVYQVIGSNAALIAFYNIVVLLCIHIVYKFRTMSMKGRASVLLFAWIMICTVILMPLAFPDLLLVVYDRYTYFLDAFVFMLLALLMSYITKKYISGSLLTAYGMASLFFTIKVNLYWKQSAYITNRLIRELPDPGDKIIVMLNLPQCLNGIPMISAEPDGQYKKLHEMFVGKLPNRVYDASAFNMSTKDDGAHVVVANDSVVRVTLNQWGTWWWFGQQGAYSYENEDYIMYMRDMGHWYDVELKHPRDRYLLLYCAGDRWRVVNLEKKFEDQY